MTKKIQFPGIPAESLANDLLNIPNSIDILLKSKRTAEEQKVFDDLWAKHATSEMIALANALEKARDK